MPLRLILLAAIVTLNGFFAAAEVSLVSVRRSRLRQLAEEGSVAARAALGLLANPPRLLSVTQVGVTLASLGLGWAGEDTRLQNVDCRGASHADRARRGDSAWRRVRRSRS